MAVSQNGILILGIDPGSRHLGLGLIEKKNNRVYFLHARVLSPPSKLPFFERLAWIGEKLEGFLSELKTRSLLPHEVAIEDVFHSKNSRSAFLLGMARGLSIAHCCRFKIPIHEYAPARVKQVVSGYGRADKAQIKKMVELSLGQTIDERWDATDALAVAICHGFSHRNVVTTNRKKECLDT